MTFTRQYPRRVTDGGDGVYRWSSDIDLKNDHYVRNLTLKISLLICGICCGGFSLMILLMGRASMAWIPLACGAAVMAITMLSFWLYRLMVRGTCTLGYEMDETSIRMIRSPREQRIMNTAGPAVMILGAVTGHAAEGLARGAMLTGAAQASRFRLSRIRSLREYPEKNLIIARTLLSSCHIWVPAEDYPLVADLLKERTSGMKPAL